MNDPLNVIQEAYACFGRGDLPGLLALMTPDIDWQFTGDRAAPYTGRVRGTAALGEWFVAVAQADDIQAFEPREFLVGADHVTVLGHERTIARATGRQFECDWVHVFRIRGARVASFWGMLDTEAAAAARS